MPIVWDATCEAQPAHNPNHHATNSVDAQGFFHMLHRVEEGLRSRHLKLTKGCRKQDTVFWQGQIATWLYQLEADECQAWHC